jgi:transcriptional regulator with XRE-family HTH domain
MDIGSRVRELREEQGLTITDLANRAGLTRNAVSRIELGHRTPGVATADKIARALGVGPGELFELPLAGASRLQ